mmetsp:Transcript_111219/g.313897  ORF Transcript_111219/g.313897 Transcript_111219/m.313897 type:complete len:278 (-) Transcript_111219:538-1371(-)
MSPEFQSHAHCPLLFLGLVAVSALQAAAFAHVLAPVPRGQVLNLQDLEALALQAQHVPQALDDGYASVLARAAVHRHHQLQGLITPTALETLLPGPGPQVPHLCDVAREVAVLHDSHDDCRVHAGVPCVLLSVRVREFPGIQNDVNAGVAHAPQGTCELVVVEPRVGPSVPRVAALIHKLRIAVLHAEGQQLNAAWGYGLRVRCADAQRTFRTDAAPVETLPSYRCFPGKTAGLADVLHSNTPALSAAHFKGQAPSPCGNRRLRGHGHGTSGPWRNS